MARITRQLWESVVPIIALTLTLLSGCGAGAGPNDGGTRDSGSTLTNHEDAGHTADAGHDAGPVDPSNPGAACTADSACYDGIAPTCLTAADEYPGGYCSGTCSVDSDCGPDGSCITYLLPSTTPDGGYVSGCMAACTTTSDCRSGYLCSNAFGANVCLPHDCRFVPDVCDSTQGCDFGTGECVSPASGYPATFPAPPQVQNMGGSVLASPKIVAIFFQNDDMTLVADLQTFFSGLPGTEYWKVLSEYGVGAATASSVVLKTNAPTTIDDTTGGALQSDLEGYISSGQIPAPDANTEYMLVYPAGTTVTSSLGTSSSTSCPTFNGYHSNFTMSGGTDIVYGVLVRCPAIGGYTMEQLLTGIATHEIVEAATDPHIRTAPAFLQVDDAHMYFDEANDGSELGDMCENDAEAFWLFPDFPYVVQRIWSNSAAAAGHDPCVPAYADEIYFNAVPDSTDTRVAFAYEGQNLDVLGTSIAVGKTAAVTLDLYSDFPLSQPWDVEVFDYYQYWENGSSALLSFSPATATGSNGSQVKINITVNAAGSPATTSNGEVKNTELFAIFVCSGPCATADYYHVTWGIVGS